MSKLKYITILFTFGVILTGCSGNQTNIQHVFKNDYQLMKRPTIKSQKLHLGMEMSEVKYIMGAPDKKKEDLNLYGAYEQWIYKPLKHSESQHWWIYLFFKDKKLVNIQRPTNY